MTDDELAELERKNAYEIEGLPTGRTVPGAGVAFPPDTFDNIRITAYLEVLLEHVDLEHQASVRAESRIKDKLEVMKSDVRKQMLAQQFAAPQANGQVLQMPNGR